LSQKKTFVGRYISETAGEAYKGGNHPLRKFTYYSFIYFIIILFYHCILLYYYHIVMHVNYVILYYIRYSFRMCTSTDFRVYSCSCLIAFCQSTIKNDHDDGTLCLKKTHQL